ncbi:MAG: hypothetical protein JNK04_20745, partial [Myxococcales bacterium]|nr:hypothetical protein [Myxococcales bacterium]
PELQGIRDRIVAALPTFDIERFDKLERYALALWQAHTQYIGASRPTAPIPEITEELKGIRDQLVLDMQGLAKRRLIDGTRIADLKGTTGSKNIASDVLVLAAVLRDSWAQLQGQTAIKLSELDHAEQLADTLHSALALKEQSHAKVSDAAELRQRCYTLMLNAYDDARRAVIFLRWKENDADEIAPSLFAGRKRASTGEEEAPAAPGTQPAPGSEIGTAPVAPPAQPAQGNGGGMPVISPFTNT